MVSDPCYTPDTWCQTKLTNVLPGKYNVEVEKSDQGDWGVRVSGITILHESITDDGVSLEWEDHSECGVDSGQCGIFCMTSYRNDELSESITTPDVNFNLGDYRKDDGGEKWYEKMCRFTLSEDQFGLYDTGVVSSSGIGDGLYPLEVMMDKEKIVGMRITYLGNSDEDLLDEDEDDEEEEFDNENNED
ncbi:MAG: hypothetical protein WCP52_11705 [Bacteroidota bacterium]